MTQPENPSKSLTRALETDDVSAIETIVRDHPGVLNASGRPAVTRARTLPTAERLLALGADLELVGKWWAMGFGTREVPSSVARLLVDQGAILTAHAAAGLGLADKLAAMLANDPSVVDAKGGDGCTPLHFSRNVEVAELLLAHKASIDARDDDHDSTAAQWLIGDVPDVSRFLLERGATPDIFLAAALGDRALAAKLIDANPECLSHRIGKMPDYPPIGYNGNGGTIYQWTLAFNSYPHQIAVAKGHQDLFSYFYERSDTVTRLLVSCLLAHRPEAEAIAARNPDLVASLPAADHELVARYCWETNTNYEAVKLMLDVGFPVAHPERSHGYSPLHNAAWAASGDLVDLLIARGHPVDLLDPTYHATPLGFAIHDCVVEKRHPEADFARVVRSLLDAGSPWDALEYPAGDASIDSVFEPRVRQTVEGAALLNDEASVTLLLGESPKPADLAKALAGAAKGGHTALCRKLLAAGAPVSDAVGTHRITPLMYAARASAGETVAVLLESGADVHARNLNESTALHLAVGNGAERETIELLLRAGAASEIEVDNKFGYSPLRMAREKGAWEIVALFEQFKSTPPSVPDEAR